MKYLSLFSGIGGFEVGIGPNHECVGYSEIDKYAIQIYQRHFPEHKNYGDIKTINASDLPDFDLLVGGFPCQPFSIAGSRKGFDDRRGTLFFDIARIIKTKRPKYLLLENVGGLLSHDNGRTYKTILSEIAKLGYDTEAMVFNSVHFNTAPRKRVYMFAADREQESDIRKRAVETAPLHACCSEGIGNTNNQIEPKGMRDAERIIRTFAKLPDWLDGWDVACDEMVIEMFGHKIFLSHIPLPKREGITKNIHGHLHGGKSKDRPDFYDESYHFEVCPEVIGYLPAKLGNF